MHKLLHWGIERMRNHVQLPSYPQDRFRRISQTEPLIHFIHGVLNPFSCLPQFRTSEKPSNLQKIQIPSNFSYHIYRPSLTGLPHSYIGRPNSYASSLHSQDERMRLSCYPGYRARRISWARTSLYPWQSRPLNPLKIQIPSSFQLAHHRPGSRGLLHS